MQLTIKANQRTLTAKFAADAIGVSLADFRGAVKFLGNVGSGSRNTLFNSADLDAICDYLGEPRSPNFGDGIEIGYSYPSSPNAVALGFKNGCYSVEIIDGVTNTRRKLAAGFNTLAEAQAYAESLELPIRLYSL